MKTKALDAMAGFDLSHLVERTTQGFDRSNAI